MIPSFGFVVVPKSLVDKIRILGIDPDIRNGGTTIVGGNQIAYMLGGIALVLLLAAIWMSFRAMRSRAQTNPGGGT